MVEIERKFLVKANAYQQEATASYKIAQGYLNSHAARTVRVRVKANKGYLTIKGKSNDTGTTRFEWEKEICLPEAEALLQLCETGIIEKTRYHVPVGKHLFEVDEFYGLNAGLVIAEVELYHENQAYIKPEWLGPEVTGQAKYYNSQLSKHPYTNW